MSVLGDISRILEMWVGQHEGERYYVRVVDDLVNRCGTMSADDLYKACIALVDVGRKLQKNGNRVYPEQEFYDELNKLCDKTRDELGGRGLELIGKASTNRQIPDALRHQWDDLTINLRQEIRGCLYQHFPAICQNSRQRQ